MAFVWLHFGNQSYRNGTVNDREFAGGDRVESAAHDKQLPTLYLSGVGKHRCGDLHTDRLAAVCERSWSSDEASTLAAMSDTFRLMTANLYNGNVDPVSLARVLATVDPDVIVCQEFARNVADVIATHFPHTDLHPASSYQGRAVAARFPFTPGLLTLPARRASIATFSAGVHPALPAGLELVGAHLVNPIDRPLRVTASMRREQVSGILEHLRGVSTPSVVAGDMNATPMYRSYRRFAAELTDMPASVKPLRTWGPWPWFPRLLRIDHIFANGLECVANQRVKVGGGDHSLLVVDLRTKQ